MVKISKKISHFFVFWRKKKFLLSFWKIIIFKNIFFCSKHWKIRPDLWLKWAMDHADLLKNKCSNKKITMNDSIESHCSIDIWEPAIPIPILVLMLEIQRYRYRYLVSEAKVSVSDTDTDSIAHLWIGQYSPCKKKKKKTHKDPVRHNLN